MTEMTLNVKFGGTVKLDIGVTPQLGQILQRLLAEKTPTQSSTQSAAVTPPAPTAAVDFGSTVRTILNPNEGETSERSEAEIDKLFRQQEPAPEPPTPVEPLQIENVTPPQEPTVTLDKEYVRAAMDSVRKRIEGPDWETDTDSPGYKRYHKQLTSIFKNLALQLAGCKPTELPNAEMILKFEDEIQQIKLDANGEIELPLPY